MKDRLSSLFLTTMYGISANNSYYFSLLKNACRAWASGKQSLLQVAGFFSSDSSNTRSFLGKSVD